jgi:hypothetical protein
VPPTPHHLDCIFITHGALENILPPSLIHIVHNAVLRSARPVCFMSISIDARWTGVPLLDDQEDNCF